LRDGSGNGWFLWISGQFAAYKCLSSEDGLMPDLKEVKGAILDQYDVFKAEPAFSMNEASCIWYLVEGEWVKEGLQIKWAFDLSEVMNWSPRDYRAWAIDYYEKDLSLAAVAKTFEGKYYDAIAVELNSEVDLVELRNDLDEIGITPSK